jgi:hypothetical protein
MFEENLWEACPTGNVDETFSSLTMTFLPGNQESGECRQEYGQPDFPGLESHQRTFVSEFIDCNEQLLAKRKRFQQI